MKLKEIWIQKDNGSRWKIIGMGNGFAGHTSDSDINATVTRESDEGVILECVESKPSVNVDISEERILREMFGEDAGYPAGYIYAISRVGLLKYYKKEYS